MIRKIDQEQKQIVNEVPSEKFHKIVIKKLERKKVYARFKDKKWVADLAEIESLSSKNGGVKYLSNVIDASPNLFVNQINYWLIYENNFTIDLCKSGYMIIMFQCTWHKMKVSKHWKLTTIKNDSKFYWQQTLLMLIILLWVKK